MVSTSTAWLVLKIQPGAGSVLIMSDKTFDLCGFCYDHRRPVESEGILSWPLDPSSVPPPLFLPQPQIGDEVTTAYYHTCPQNATRFPSF
jgi:hypothetical protein